MLSTHFGLTRHFAIIHEDLEMVKLLVTNGADCRTPRATGSFLYSNSKLYFGGSLLGFAACLDNLKIVEYLLTNEHCRADPNSRDPGPNYEYCTSELEDPRDPPNSTAGPTTRTARARTPTPTHADAHRRTRSHATDR